MDAMRILAIAYRLEIILKSGKLHHLFFTAHVCNACTYGMEPIVLIQRKTDYRAIDNLSDRKNLVNGRLQQAK